MASIGRKRIVGIALLVAAVAVAGGAWIGIWRGGPSTDNAYVRGDITSLAPKVAGYVIAVEVADNQAVQAGDVLFRIDDRDYRAKLAQAEANVAAARARLSSAGEEILLQHSLVRQAGAQREASLADLDLAKRASDRRQKLIQANAVSQSQVEESDAARSRADAGASAASATLDAQRQRVDVLISQREAAIAAIAQAEAARDLAKIDLENTVVHAPIAGVVGNRQVRIGRLVAPGSSLLDIVPVTDLWIVANFKETQLESIRIGQRASIKVDGYPSAAFAGVVDSFAPGSGSSFSLLPADNATGNFVRVVQRVPVKIRLKSHPDLDRLLPGLSARVTIEPGSGS
ncbi:MAG: HlyD family secretion protein [Hyphomicrobiales bacterium]|nr:MAG: HlyD family secretion protein [Hyphomicrobiales bacterium]